MEETELKEVDEYSGNTSSKSPRVSTPVNKKLD